MKTETHQKFINRKNAEFGKYLAITIKDIGRKAIHKFKREEWTFMPQHNLTNKVFIIERLRRVEIQGKSVHKNIKVGDVVYRFGYYIVGHNGRAKNKWVWGQFCPIIPVKDFNKLLEKARREGTLRKRRTSSESKT